MAQSGADLIRSESDYSNKLFQSFFKTTDQQSKNRVLGALHKIATEIYGYDAVHQLSSGSALENAESYAFFSKCKLCTSFKKGLFLIWTIVAFLNCQGSN